MSEVEQQRARIILFSTVEYVAAAIDAAALCPGRIGEQPADCGLPRSTWQAVVRARRMRVFEWMIDAGFWLLNLCPDANSHFLALAERYGLEHKYSAARMLWRSLHDEVADHQGWLNAIAETEILLVELREGRPIPKLPVTDRDDVALSQGVRLTQLAPESLALHDTIPQYSIPASKAVEQLAQLRQRFPARPLVLQQVLVVPGCGEEPEGQLIQVEPEVASALAATAHQARSVAQLREQIGAEDLKKLIELGALSRC